MKRKTSSKQKHSLQQVQIFQVLNEVKLWEEMCIYHVMFSLEGWHWDRRVYISCHVFFGRVTLRQKSVYIMSCFLWKGDIGTEECIYHVMFSLEEWHWDRRVYISCHVFFGRVTLRQKSVYIMSCFLWKSDIGTEECIYHVMFSLEEWHWDRRVYISCHVFFGRVTLRQKSVYIMSCFLWKSDIGTEECIYHVMFSLEEWHWDRRVYISCHVFFGRVTLGQKSVYIMSCFLWKGDIGTEKCIYHVMFSLEEWHWDRRVYISCHVFFGRVTLGQKSVYIMSCFLRKGDIGTEL